MYMCMWVYAYIHIYLEIYILCIYICIYIRNFEKCTESTSTTDFCFFFFQPILVFFLAIASSTAFSCLSNSSRLDDIDFLALAPVAPATGAGAIFGAVLPTAGSFGLFPLLADFCGDTAALALWEDGGIESGGDLPLSCRSFTAFSVEKIKEFTVCLW